MARPNKSVSFQIEEYETLRDSGLLLMPRAEIFNVSINPYNGSCRIGYQRHPDSMAMVDYLFGQYGRFAKSFKKVNGRSATFADFAAHCEVSEKCGR